VACISTYQAKASDTPNLVAAALQVSTDRLLTYNNIVLTWNTTFPTGQILCLDNVPKCLTRAVQSSDSCSSLLSLIGSSVTEVMLRSWNPTVGHDCGNLKNMAGKLICISPPGTTESYSEKPASSTSTSTVLSDPGANWTWSTVQLTTLPTTFTANRSLQWTGPPNYPSVTTVNATAPASSAVSAALARITYCPFIGEGSDDWNAGLGADAHRPSLHELDPSCQTLWKPYCTANLSTPVLPSPKTIPSSCYPLAITTTRDYVPPPAATQSGSPENCNQWYIVVSGDSCDAIDSKYSITLSQLKAWNPSINSQCSNLMPNFAYCVRVWIAPPDSTTSTTTSATLAPPAPTSSGTSTACHRWHVDKNGNKITHIILPFWLSADIRCVGDTCDSISTLYGIIASRLRQLNRSLNSACDNLIVGNAYCVG
jgi:LysM repeat protein